MQGFKDKVVLITGAASGFGKIMAQRLSAAGAKLVLGDINIQALNELTETLESDVVALSCNVSKEDEVKALADAAVEHFQRLDIAVNNAGIAGEMKASWRSPKQRWISALG